MAQVSEQQRFEMLILSHQGIVYRVVRTYCRLEEDQQDLIQEIKLQLWRAFPKYDSSKVFSTWMYRIALNTAISWTRKSSRRVQHVATLDEAEHEATQPIQSDELQVLYTLIDSLDAINRALLLLYLEELSLNEIGEVLGISPGNAAVKLTRLKQQLRQLANEPQPNEK